MAAKKKQPREIRVDPSLTTISQAQAAMVELVRADTPVVCPCCKQRVELEEKFLTPAVAKALIVLCRYFRENKDWLKVQDYISDMNKLGAEVRNSDWQALLHWGFLTEKPGNKGLYMMPEKALKFALGETREPKTVKLYRDKVVGFGEQLVFIKECLGGAYNYDSLMAGEFGVFLV